MFHGLNRAVFSPHHRPQSLPQPVNTLMMGGVHPACIAVDRLQIRSLFNGCPVGVVAPAGQARVMLRSGKMLNQRPAEGNVQQLVSPADAEYRLPRRKKSLQRRKLNRVQLVVDGSLCGFLLSVPRRSNVASSRQQQSVKAGRIKVASGLSRAPRPVKAFR